MAAVSHAHAMGMAATAANLPLHSRNPSSFFHLPTKKRRQNRLLEQRRTEQAALQEEASLRAQAWIYLSEFLHNSTWNDQLDQITIVRDAVPTMPELSSYGDLDDKEGTRACRRLFKAVVVWDELGHSLWKTLRAASEQRRLAQRQFEELSTAGPAGYPDDLCVASRRSSRRASQASLDSGRSRESASSALSTADKKQRAKLSKKLSCSSAPSSARASVSSSASVASSRRTSCETEPPAGLGHCACCHVRRGADLAPAADSESLRPSAIPKIISHNYASAVRRTLGMFGESRAIPSAGRQSR